MKKAAILVFLPLMLMLSGAALADDPPVEPTAVTAPADEAKPTVTAGEVKVDPVKSDDPVADAEKLIDGATETIDNDPGATVNQLIQLAKEGRWGPFVGLLLMFLIWALRKFIWKLIPKSVLPWVTLGAGMLATGAIELGLGVTWWKVLIDAFATSGIAMGFWSLVFKHFMKPKEEEPKPA